ncbi:HET domain-containing protein [Poseidonibacter lekithochrous]|uniref:HET domain-containing protein n=1 Tax=Poseidonibacter TaxID=2321187 RepID=UPI001C08B568|nr:MULTISPECIES: HET domain-containing protein [Poseidonibacter]MBU3014720.1 HET domain-containing protein [Poseidonibacter lekithochrous]MDO6828018.1 HET domain-containing protein [Poseidonibacter sp. 1_MG-2023]
MSNFFKLLIPVTEANVSSTKTIKLCGKMWTLVDFKQLSDAPPFTCISYSWGIDKSLNPLNSEKEISARTIPVIETVINSFESDECWNTEIESLFHSEDKLAKKLALAHKASSAIWIDALCSPQEQPAADICIQNMGEIYKSAAQIFVVLNTNCLDTVNRIYNRKPLSLNDYIAVANDDWIDRVWTYQEFVNSKMMFLIAEGKEKKFISELNFLNALMTYATAYSDIQDIDMYQKLERMQLLVAAQQINAQSAFQAMSAVSRRFATRQEDRINVMISVVTNGITSEQNLHLIPPIEHFMNICEENNDFSFIFSTNPRSEVVGKRWRPIGNQLIAVISDVSVYGSGLSGCINDTHLQMNNMCKMVPWKNNLIISSIDGFINGNLSKLLFEGLRQRGFEGCGECIKLEEGYFFPQSPHKRSKDLFVVVSNDVKFHQGAPALLLRSNDTDINQFCDTGIFIGKPPKNSENINVS